MSNPPIVIEASNLNLKKSKKIQDFRDVERQAIKVGQAHKCFVSAGLYTDNSCIQSVQALKELDNHLRILKDIAVCGKLENRESYKQLLDRANVIAKELHVLSLKSKRLIRGAQDRGTP